MAISYSEFVKKKVLGVPVLYIAAAAVTILAIVAWRLKATPDTNTAGTSPEDGTAGATDNTDSSAGGLAGMNDPYGSYDTNGTVVVQPQQPTGNPAVEETNDTWLKATIPLTATALKQSQGTVQAALVKYLDGDDLSFAEGQIRDTAIEKSGLPPEGVSKIGITSDAPAQKQFAQFPGSHTVKGTNDNTPTKLATLYYGAEHAADGALKIASKNTNKGPVTTTYPVGTVVAISEYVSPGYYVATKTTPTAPDIAAKSGTTADVIRALNPNLSEPYAVGTKVRNH